MLTLILAAAAAAAPVHASEDDNAVKCVRQPMTGSLIGFKKVCRTNAEWRELHRQQQEQFDTDMRSSAHGSSGNG